jgi:hypothetical protein
MSVAAPVANFLDYPFRAIPADVYGATKAALAPSGKGQEEFWKGRAAVMGATQLPETSTGQAISTALNAPASLIGAGIGKLSRATLGPELTQEIAPYATVAGDVAPIIGGKLISGTMGKAGDLVKSITGNTSAGIDRFIDNAYQRAAKPGVTAGRTAPRVQEHMEEMRGAIDSIIDRKANLQFTDPAGTVRTGDLPRSLDEFGQAISQTKQQIFQEYDALQQAAGRAGAKVDLKPTVAELAAITVDPVISDLHPEVARYAGTRAIALNNRGTYSPAETQRAIQHLNASLQAFYQEPRNTNLAGNAMIDSMVANKLRESLDSTITNATGPGYQELKNQYGNLKAIEREVVNRATIEGRKELGGGILGRIGDVVSAREVISGMMHLHPATVASGVTLKALTNYINRRRSPNRAVQQIFQKAEKQRGGMPPTTVSPMTGTAVGTMLTPSRAAGP